MSIKNENFEKYMLEYIDSLYAKYADDLSNAYRFSSICYENSDLEAQFGVYEADLLFLLAKDAAPNKIVEISPCGGYSSTFLYQATRNGQTYESFDIHDRSQANLPESVRKVRNFHLGDVRNHKFDEQIDFLLMDSDHSYEFCDWYVENVFPAVSENSWIFVNDIFDHDGGWYHEKFPFCGTIQSSPNGREGTKLVQFLESKNVEEFFNIQKNSEKLLNMRRKHNVIDLPANIPQVLWTLSSSVIFRKSW